MRVILELFWNNRTFTSIIQEQLEITMGKCNEIISKVVFKMMMMVKIYLKVAIFHADFEEKAALTTSSSLI